MLRWRSKRQSMCRSSLPPSDDDEPIDDWAARGLQHLDTKESRTAYGGLAWQRGPRTSQLMRTAGDGHSALRTQRYDATR